MPERPARPRSAALGRDATSDCYRLLGRPHHRSVEAASRASDGAAVAVLVDVAAHLVRSSSSSLTKNALADFNISFARRNSKFSAHGLRIS